MSTLSMHGKFSLNCFEQIIYIDSTGPLNIEYFHAMHKALSRLTSTFTCHNYVALLTPIDEVVSVKDAIELHANFLRKSNTKAIAVDFSLCTSPQITKFLCKKMYGQAGIKYQFFDDRISAETWLKQVLNENLPI